MTLKLVMDDAELVEEAIRTAYLELRTLEEQLDWFSSDSIEGLENALRIMGCKECD